VILETLWVANQVGRLVGWLCAPTADKEVTTGQLKKCPVGGFLTDECQAVELFDVFLDGKQRNKNS